MELKGEGENGQMRGGKERNKKDKRIRIRKGVDERGK